MSNGTGQSSLSELVAIAPINLVPRVLFPGFGGKSTLGTRLCSHGNLSESTQALRLFDFVNATIQDFCF